MDLYTSVSYATSRQLTLRYSSSFGISSRLFSSTIRPHIYAVYGLVRLADEIVDTYRGPDALARLNDLESAMTTAIKTGFDTNPIIHAFAQTARVYMITAELTAPFFESMRMDLPHHTYDSSQYETYIYGSAEVVGLMCLRIFCEGNNTTYEALKSGAQALGAAYQKINFLRDLAEDYTELGRIYFPGISFKTFDETAKQTIISNIRTDLDRAQPALRKLPKSCRSAVAMSYVYYDELLKRLELTSAQTIKMRRIRIPSRHKVQLLARTYIKEKLSK